MNIKIKAVGFKKNTKKHGLLSRYNIISYLLLGIGYVSVKWIPYSCSECLSKMPPPMEYKSR